MRLLAASLACLLALNLTPTDTHAAVVVNGDFSAPLTTGWTVNGNVSGGNGAPAVLSTEEGAIAHDLIRGALGIPDDVSAGWWEGSYIFQELSAIPIGGGELSFDWDFNYSNGPSKAFVSFYDAVSDNTILHELASGASDSDSYSFNGLIAGVEYRLGFGVVDIGDADGESLLSISNVTFTPNVDLSAVPEPTTLAMLGFSCGGLAVGIIRKRRNSKAEVSADAETTI